MIKIVLFTRMLSNSFENIEENTLKNCETIDYYFSRYANSSPHYMGKMGNFLVQKSMEESVVLSLKSVSLLVSLSENVIDFMLDLWLGTWVCLLVSAIDGSVDVATNATESLIDFVNGTVSEIANDIDDGLNGLSKVINKALEAIDNVKDFFSEDDDSSEIEDKVKTVNLTIESLRSFSIPSSIDEKLTKLSANTPDFKTVKNKTKEAIAVPFDLIRAEIKSINTSELIGDKNLLTVPPLESDDSKICTDNIPLIKSFFGSLKGVLRSCTVAVVVIFTICAVGFMVYVAWSEWREWRRLEQFRDQYRNQYLMLRNPFDAYAESKSLENVDILETYQLVFHKYQSTLARWLATSLSKDQEIQRNVRWMVAFLTSPTALTLLVISLCGIIMCCIQFIVIALLSNALNGEGASMTISSISTSMNQSLNRELADWSNSTNVYINSTEFQINQQVFGWIQNTTTTINGTVTELINDIDLVITKTFNGTILYKPMDTVVACVIGNKLDTIVAAMDWVHNSAQIHLPRVNTTELTYLLEKTTNETSAASSPASAPPMTQDIQNAIVTQIEKILTQYRNTVYTELFISLAILLIYTMQFPVAAAFILFDKYRAQAQIVP